MCYITANGYNRMQQITDALNGMTPEMQDLASLNCVEEAVKILKNRGAKNEDDCADNDKMFEQWMKERGETVEPDEGAAGSKGAV